MSESRPFEFTPLDAGRAYWSAKRLKTNYSVFNQILTRDQALRTPQHGGGAEQANDTLKHKVPLGRAPVMAGLFTPDTPGHGATIATPEHSGDNGAAGQLRQTLRPVAMPGAKPSVRPGSDMSLMSDMTMTTGADTLSLATRQSVNEILSMADTGSLDLELDTISVNTLLTNPMAAPVPAPVTSNVDIKIEPPSSDQNTSLSVPTDMGSLSSVATVRENVLTNDNVTNMTSATSTPMDVVVDSLDLDIGQIYDDVMQCVYDDVDIKYDDVEIIMADQPPVPPQRQPRGERRETNIDADIHSSVSSDLNKPLPAAPRNNILTKLTEKKNELMEAREKEMEKKRELDEQRKREKEEKKRKEKEEREAKKREEDEKKAKIDEQKMKSSLFQRLFQRSQSRPQDMAEDDNDCEHETVEHTTDQDAIMGPPVPAHQSAYLSQVSMNARLSELEELISGDTGAPGVIDDSILTELARQFPSPPDTQSQQQPTDNTPAVHS